MHQSITGSFWIPNLMKPQSKLPLRPTSHSTRIWKSSWFCTWFYPKKSKRFPPLRSTYTLPTLLKTTNNEFPFHSWLITNLTPHLPKGLCILTIFTWYSLEISWHFQYLNKPIWSPSLFTCYHSFPRNGSNQNQKSFPKWNLSLLRDATLINYNFVAKLITLIWLLIFQ